MQVEHCGRLLIERGYNVDVTYTSRLKRAIRSSWIILRELGKNQIASCCTVLCYIARVACVAFDCVNRFIVLHCVVLYWFALCCVCCIAVCYMILA